MSLPDVSVELEVGSVIEINKMLLERTIEREKQQLMKLRHGGERTCFETGRTHSFPQPEGETKDSWEIEDRPHETSSLWTSCGLLLCLPDFPILKD